MKWEYAACYHYCNSPSRPDPSEIWDKDNKSYKESGSTKSTWDKIVEYGNSGWELVNTTFVSTAGSSVLNNRGSSEVAYYLFMFKRPKQDRMIAAGHIDESGNLVPRTKKT